MNENVGRAMVKFLKENGCQVCSTPYFHYSRGLGIKRSGSKNLNDKNQLYDYWRERCGITSLYHLLNEHPQVVGQWKPSGKNVWSLYIDKSIWDGVTP